MYRGDERDCLAVRLYKIEIGCFYIFLQKAKMSAKERLAIQRALQRVSNALNNPTTTESIWQDAWAGVKGCGVLSEDIAVWWLIGLEKRRFDMLQTLAAGHLCPFKRTRVANETAVFTLLVRRICEWNTPMLRGFMLDLLRCCRFNDAMYELLYRNAEIPALQFIFALRCTEPVIMDLYYYNGYKRVRTLIAINKAFKERRTARWRLVRFWLLVKKIMVGWRETLYEPGTGALYKKALLSFSQDN